ncbi:MAG: hypothetical protein ABJQ29_08955 [Luteolibacter sp.]
MSGSHKKVGSRLLVALLALLAIILVAANIHDRWYARQPLSVHLRDVFEESGFHVPDYVTDIQGSKGFVDFQGDYSASVSFVVHPEDIDEFMRLPAKVWKNPRTFKVIEESGRCGEFAVPAGSYMISEWTSSEYNCKYAVDKSLRRIYFYRSST